MKNLLIPLVLAIPSLAAAQQSCYAEMWNKPGVRPVAQRLDTSAPGAEAKLRANNAKPTAKEKEALAVLLDEMMACQKLAHEERKDKMHPEAQSVVRGFEMEMNSLVTRLYASRMTWGEFVEGREKASSEMMEKAQAVNAKIQAEHDAWAAEMNRRQKLAEEQAEQQRLAALRADFQRQQQAEALQRQAEQNRRDQANREIMNGLMLMQAAQPRPALRCRSTTFFDTVNTTCN